MFRMFRIAAAILFLVPATGLPGLAKERSWLSAELVKINETQTESEEELYKSSQPNNTSSAPLASAGTEKHTKKIYTYVFKVADKEYKGRVEKKPIPGLTAGSKLNIVVQRGWLIVQMPDGKEKKMDFLE